MTLPTWYYGTTPNFPNFRLGALRGSPCDTLGIEEGAEYVCQEYVSVESSKPFGNESDIKIYPNPANDILNIKISQNDVSLYYKIYDILGRELQNGVISLSNGGAGGYQISFKNLNNGIYYVSIYENNHLLGSTKFVVLHE